MNWYKNENNNYIFVEGRFSLLKKIWLWLNGYKEVDHNAKSVKFMEEQQDDLYRFLNRKQ